MTLFELLDTAYGEDGDNTLKMLLNQGDDPNHPWSPDNETALHVATRRRRLDAVRILLDHGVDINAQNGHKKTAYAHAIRRGFDEVAEFLKENGADTSIASADEFAVAVGKGDLDHAKQLLAAEPGIIRTGNPEEDRLLADMAGRNDSARVKFLIDAGADLHAPALDDGTPLHQTAWFGQPQNAKLLIEAGASLDIFDKVHQASPIHWAAHGSRYSGGAENRQDVYQELVHMLLEAGSSLFYPNDTSNAYKERLIRDASQKVQSIFEEWFS